MLDGALVFTLRGMLVTNIWRLQLIQNAEAHYLSIEIVSLAPTQAQK